MAIGKRIQKLRKERNMSQAALAELAGLKAPAISQYESGARQPNFESLIKLSRALGVPSDYLLTGGDTTTSNESGDSLSRLITHMATLLPIDKRQMLLDYALFLNRPVNSTLAMPYFTDVRSYADYVFQQMTDISLPVNLSKLLERLSVSKSEAKLDNCEGLVVKGKESIIILDPRQENRQRVRFTIAMLLGHLIVPWHTDTLYRARERSGFMTENLFEMEAQQFASYLLMPREILNQDLRISSVSLNTLQKLAGEKYDVSVFSMANALVDLHPDKFAVVQSDGKKILKTFQGLRRVRSELDMGSLAASFYNSPPKEREMRTAKLNESMWFEGANSDAYVLEESIYDPGLNTVLTLLTIQ